MNAKDWGLALSGVGVVICFVYVVVGDNPLFRDAWIKIRNRCSSWSMWQVHRWNRAKQDYYDLCALQSCIESEELQSDNSEECL